MQQSGSPDELLVQMEGWGGVVGGLGWFWGVVAGGSEGGVLLSCGARCRRPP